MTDRQRSDLRSSLYRVFYKCTNPSGEPSIAHAFEMQSAFYCEEIHLHFQPCGEVSNLRGHRFVYDLVILCLHDHYPRLAILQRDLSQIVSDIPGAPKKRTEIMIRKPLLWVQRAKHF